MLYTIRIMDKPPNQSSGSVLAMLGIVWTIGFMVAVPLVGFALLGRYADKAFNSSPLFFLSGVVVSIIVSSILIFRKTMQLMHEAEKRQE
ncbi:AtpZ/AtpI family protein [Candidatus Uhrbacteria bacterium]|nr:AtpZ/AtpI family protein [Candidatus Uhrbacteria bacterium]